MRAQTKRFDGARLEQAALVLDRWPGLGAAMERFAAGLPVALAQLVEGVGACEAEPPRAALAQQALSDCAGLTAGLFEERRTHAKVLFALDADVEARVVAAVFGPGADERDRRAGRTEVEAELIEAYARALGAALQTAFASLGPFELRFQGLVTLNEEFALGESDAPVIAARFSVALPQAPSECLLVAPQAAFARLRKALAITPKRAETDPQWRQRLEAEVSGARLRVSAVLDETRMTLGEIARLAVGQVLPLAKEGIGEVRLDCGGRGVFWCKLGEGDGRYRLTVERPVIPEQ